MASLQKKAYLSYSSPVGRTFQAATSYQTTFVPALMLACLAAVPEAEAVRADIAAWLLRQRSKAWSFNYWAANAPERNTLPYPDDLDDTFCALLGLRLHDAALVPEAALGCAVRLLLATETKVGGPYRTWLVEADAPAVWQDVDLAVNSNIACFLEQVGSPLPNLTAYMQSALVNGTLRSPYYPSEYPLLYYLARAYRGTARQTLVTRLLQLQHNGYWDTPLQTALALTALHRLGELAPHQDAVMYLRGQQLPDGSWPAEGFCFDPAQKGKQYVNGSAALTTAFVLEALVCSRPAKPEYIDRVPMEGGGELEQRIRGQAATQSSQLPTVLRVELEALLSGLMRGSDGQEVMLLPSLFARSLRKPPNIRQATLVELGLANVYGWLAYTVFDNFLDDEGTPRQLPAALTALRQSVASFWRARPKDQAFQAVVGSMFNTIDAANAWELRHCRFVVGDGNITIGRLPDYRPAARLFERSLGHALTPIAVLAAAGYSPSSPQTGHVVRAFQHYLAARQLNDDLHDWEQDMSRGQVSYVVAGILRELQVAPGDYALVTLVPRMRTRFWNHTLLNICDVVVRHTKQARRELRLSGACRDDSPLHELLNRLDATAARTRTEQSGAEAFLAAYRGELGVDDHGRSNGRPGV
ncbi:MAG TPA: hypothetical protein VLI54_03925 [Bacillota bacterium]|nr:hypothetical protein [Bacillota bacterium]